MPDPSATRPSLLLRIRDPAEQQAWSQFVEIYAPLVYGFARKQGLQDADAADLTQEVLRAVARGARSLDYDPQRGSFRGWLFTIVRNKLRDTLAARRQRVQPEGGTEAHRLLSEQPAPAEEQEWQREYQQRQFAWAAEQVRGEVQPTTWEAFWKTAVENFPPRDVAEQLGMSVAAVYLAKSRVMARLKDHIRQLESE